MSTIFPANLDAFNNPTTSSNLNSPGVEHNLQHSDANDAIEAIETKLGVNNSTDVNSVDYKLRQLQSKFVTTGAPASATATGTAGTIIVTGGYLYVCTDTNTWVRAVCGAW